MCICKIHIYNWCNYTIAISHNISLTVHVHWISAFVTFSPHSAFGVFRFIFSFCIRRKHFLFSFLAGNQCSISRKLVFHWCMRHNVFTLNRIKSRLLALTEAVFFFLVLVKNKSLQILATNQKKKQIHILIWKIMYTENPQNQEITILTLSNDYQDTDR